MENKEDKEKIDNKLQTELLVEIEKHERRVLDVLDRLSKKSDEDLPAEFKDASIVLASATKELKVLMKEHENDKEVYENLIDTISKRVATIPEEFVVKNLEDFPTKFEFDKPDWWKEYPEPKEFPSEIKISNLPKSQDNKDLKSHLTKLFTGLWDATKEHTAKVFVSNRTPKEAIPVVLVDAEGRQKYTAIFSGGGSGAAAAGGVSVTQYKEDAVHNSGDTGTMSLGVRSDTLAPLAADGDYTPFQTDAKGAVWVHEEPSLIDTGNSTTATLTGGSVFTGTGKDVLNYQAITIQLDASHNSATDGMKFQFSTDNTNWDDVYPFTYTAADGARRFQFPSTARYFRVVYTNGGTNQTHLRIQTILHHTTPLTSIHRLVDDTNNDRSAQIVKAAIIAQKAGGGPGAGDFIAIQSTAGGNLKVSVEEVSGAPTIDSYTQVAINLNAGTNQVLVSSAPNKQIWVYAIVYTCSVAGTVSFQDELDTAITGIMDHAANSGLSHPLSGNFAMPIWKLATDKDLEVDVVTAAIDGWLDYAIVSV